MAFAEWGEETYEDEEGDFRQAYTQLCEKKVGLDVLNDLSADDLITGCKVEFGTAWRIVKGYLAWRESLKVPFYPPEFNPTMMKLIRSNLRRNLLANGLFYFQRHLIKIFIRLELIVPL